MAQNASASIMEATKRLLRIALVGAPNAGKSTLLNRLILSDISCVSNKVHTTRDNVLGVYTENNTQLEFLDSPGIITRQHSLRHRLEESMLRGPEEAAKRCDLIAVIVDATNLRDCNKLNRNILRMLEEHTDKKSYLILNKVDLIKEKRLLLDISTRLSEGHLEGRLVIPKHQFDSLMKRNHFDFAQKHQKPLSKHVIELEPKYKSRADNPPDERPAATGYRNFSQIYSISALHDDGIDELRSDMLAMAKPVETWPHGPDYLSNQASKDIVSSIIRGKVMDNVEHEIPYLVRYHFQEFRYDELGSLHVILELLVPHKYMVGKLLGQHGVVIFKITNESRDIISRTLGCDVKLNLVVNSK